MNKTFYWILLMIFIAIAVFGFSAMGHQGCIMTIATQTSCMQGQGSFTDVISHLQVYKSFSMAVLTAMLAVALLAVLSLTRCLKEVSAVVVAEASRASARAFEKRAVMVTVARKVKQRLLAWLAIQQRRDYDLLATAGA